MKRIVLIITAIFFLVAGSSAQQAAADVPASKDDVNRLLVAVHFKERIQLMLEESRKHTRLFLIDYLLKQVPAAADKREQVQTMVDEYVDEIYKDYPVDSIVNGSISVYQKHLTKSDVNAVIDFYSTPVGQKFLNEYPAILSELMQITQSRMEPRLQEATVELTKKLTKMIGDDKGKPN